jgi:hypothetical protein
MAKLIDAQECPLALQSNSLNIKNHLKGIEEKGLGPADPRKLNIDFWEAKAAKWGVSEGDARGRLCNNCRFYVNATPIKQCIDNGPAKDIKASALPLTPKWADIESKPTAYCTLLDITCSPTRTCDFQQLGGPIDDEKMQLPDYEDILTDYNEEEAMEYAEEAEIYSAYK